MDSITKEEVRAKAKAVCEAHGCQTTELIVMLQEIQEEYKYLPKEAVYALAEGLNIPAHSVYGVATFYAQFSLDPKGKYLVKCCDGTACHVKNGALIFDAVQQKMNFHPGKNTTVDGLFTLETVACLGACGIAPVMVINEQVYPQMDPDAAVAVIESIMAREKEGQAA